MPARLTQQQKDHFFSLAASGLDVKAAARMAGVSYSWAKPAWRKAPASLIDRYRAAGPQLPSEAADQEARAAEKAIVRRRSLQRNARHKRELRVAAAEKRLAFYRERGLLNDD